MAKFILVGMSGSGKTTLGKAVSEKSNMMFIDLDQVIEKKHGSISEIFKNRGEKTFRILETEELENALSNDNVIISTGGGILGKEKNRELLLDDVVIFVNRELQKIKQSMDDTNRPMVKNKPGMLEKLYKDRFSQYQIASSYTVYNNGSKEDCINDILSVINRCKEGQ